MSIRNGDLGPSVAAGDAAAPPDGAVEAVEPESEDPPQAVPRTDNATTLASTTDFFNMDLPP
ncbi:hypothetical protein D3C71_2165480 [compost metagenome]